MRGTEETHKGEGGRTNLQIMSFIQATDYPVFRIHTSKPFLVLA